MSENSILENVRSLRQVIADAALSVGRNPSEILLCAATKMNDADSVRQAILAGVDCCGENRVQELTEKLSQDAYRNAPIHFIGHLQTNKVRQVVGRVDLIQSVGSLHLLEAIHTEAEKQNLCQQILLEINIGNEAAKTGFLVEDLPAILEKMYEFPHISVKGLMAIPPIPVNSGDNVKFFQKMYQLSVDIQGKKYDNVTVDCLSMGMSGDFIDAIRCGSTMVRIGTAIFGARNYGLSHQK